MSVTRNVAALFERPRPEPTRALAERRRLPTHIDFHGTRATLVPGRHPTVLGPREAVDSFYLLSPLRRHLVGECVRATKYEPIVHFGMGPKGDLVVAKTGKSASDLHWVDAIMSNADLSEGSFELVGEPQDALAYWKSRLDDSNPDHVILGLNPFELSAIAAYLNDKTLATSAPQLGAATLMSEAQLRMANAQSELFVGEQNLPGMPRGWIGHWTGDLADLTQLDLPARERINARRVWLYGNFHNDGWPLPGADRIGRNNPNDHYDNMVSRLAVAVAPQDSEIP
jgi:hypothetical protein